MMTSPLATRNATIFETIKPQTLPNLKPQNLKLTSHGVGLTFSKEGMPNTVTAIVSELVRQWESCSETERRRPIDPPSALYVP